METLRREAHAGWTLWPPGARIRCKESDGYKLATGQDYIVSQQPTRGVVVLKEFPGLWFTSSRFKRVVRVQARTSA
jgi:hypothetical protein